ncbi:UPF0102 protein [Marivirga lumbricoides]|uniref:UPF0102 protein C9994_00675 n=1 Tax=Marivirga lumbricoides TaxID=1046115 RepID=A0A2T4DVL4_9BACT|nr:YraN family protein [Marivirga lumbricoides]GGC46038.1 UPF0102 protein [Marivirga lumbricoides]
MSTKKTGDLGEDIAAKILTKKGYEILERNYRYKRSEIDLICLFSDLLVFIEVKALNSTRFGHPEDRVNNHKIEKVIEAAEDYIYAINWQKDIRFDILSIDLKHPDNFLHIEDAFY